MYLTGKKLNLTKLNLNLNVRIIHKVCFSEDCVTWIFSQAFQHFSNSENQPKEMEGPEGGSGSDHLDSLTRLA